MNCLIYLRVSTEKQVEKGLNEEGYSIPGQREACLRYIRDNGWHCVGEYTDLGESARSVDRPQLQEMLSRIKKDPTIDTVVVHKVDRLARKTEDHFAIKTILKSHNVTLVSVSENIDDSASGMLIEGIMAVLADYYSKNLGKEAQKGMLQKAKQGGWPQMAPIGYLNKKEIANGREISTIEVDTVRGPIIAEAFKRYATGNYSIKQLHEFATKAGLKTRPTRKWSEQPIATSTLGLMLQNKFYTGHFDWKGVEYQGNHTPLVDFETFEKVQDILKLHNVGPRVRTYHHYLKGVVFCAESGSRLSLDTAKNQYLYFYCLGRKKKPKCTMPYIAVCDVEKGVEDFYEGISLKQEHIDKIVREFKEQMLARENDDYRQTELASKRIEKLKKEKIRLAKAYSAGAFDLDILQLEKERVDKEMKEAHELLTAITAQTEIIEHRLMLAIKAAEGCGLGYKKGLEKTRELFNQAIFKKIYINKDGSVARADFTPIFETLIVHKKFELEQFGSPDRIRT